MAKEKEKKQNRRRFEEPERKPWSEDERNKYAALRDRLAPIVRDLTTPAVSEKKKDPLEAFIFGDD